MNGTIIPVPPVLPDPITDGFQGVVFQDPAFESGALVSSPNGQSLDGTEAEEENIQASLGVDPESRATAETTFYQDHPVVTGVGALALVYALYRNYRFRKKVLPPAPKLPEGDLPDEELFNEALYDFGAHFEELKAMQNALYSVRPEEVPTLYDGIYDRVTEQGGVYEQRVSSLNREIDAIKAKEAVDQMDGARLLKFVELRNAVFKSFQLDVAFLDGLMENWHVRQIASAHDNLRTTEERYFNLENSWIKTVPMYAVNLSNSVCSLVGALLMLSVLNTGLPYLLHDTFPDLIPEVADPNAHIKAEAFTKFLKQITLFGLSFDAVYAGAKGMRCRNTNWIGARAWNGVLDTVGLPFKAAEPATRLISGALHAVMGRPWEVATRYGYRLTRLGALGVVRQIGRDLTMSPNGAATRIVRKIRSDAPEIRPFGHVGDISAGMLIGSIFDWSVGVFENIMQNIIVGAQGNTLSEKVGASLAKPFALAWQNAAPTAACNLLHANATAKVSQYPGNDDIQVVWSRFFLGVIKGSLLTALITTSAINGEAAAATAVILGAQFFIGGNSIVLSRCLTNPGMRAKAANLVTRIKGRFSQIWKSLRRSSG